MNKVLVYSPQNSERLTYVLGYFSRTLELDFSLTNQLEELHHTIAPCINYSQTPIKNAFQILPSDLLFEKGIKKQTIKCTEWNHLPCFFYNKKGEIPFDIFAASFYLLTRYEEYCCKKTDFHGRFPFNQSLAFSNNFLHRPLVDLWAFELLQIIAPQHQVKRAFCVQPTIDVDNFYKYRRKGILGTILLILRDLYKGETEEIKTRLKVLFHLSDDPFFNFHSLAQWHKLYGNTHFFFHLGGFGHFDKRVLLPNFSKRYQTAIKSISKNFEVGIHPSYKAAFTEKRFAKEHLLLTNLICKKVQTCRFHFLRFRLPKSYRMLVSNGITDDFSMLYAENIGFRASTSLPYPFFDLEQNSPLPLIIHPTAIMDTIFLKKTGAEQEQLFALTQQMLNDVKRTKGVFVTLFHNEHLSSEEKNKTIVNFYKSLLNQAKFGNNEKL